MCFLYERSADKRKKRDKWHKIGQTEQLKNTLNPDFRTSITIPYYFEREQYLKLVVIDGDGLGEYDRIGKVKVSLGNIMGARAQTWQGTLSHDGRTQN